MNKYFTLNEKWMDMYHSLLLFFTIVIIHVSSQFILFKKKPTKHELHITISITLAIVLFYLFINPCQKVHVVSNDKHNNHITKV
jgi:hypothetical protein